MKRTLFAVILLLLISPALRQAKGDSGVSVNFFYDNIESDGSWVELGDYGYCWQPAVAVSNVRWRPYWDGYWAYTDVGWTWISYEDFGWATYHYGRWVRLHDRGWYWVPGREWAPAWVSWRTGGDYVGWAPLPPRTVDEYVEEGSPITGHVDVAFDIGPAYYNFIDVRYIGEPVLRERIYEPSQNVTYITNTVNVTNITYANSMVHNYGPDYNTLSQYSTRPIRRMTLERNTTVDPNVAAKSKSLTKVEGDKLVVAAPLTLQKSTTPVAPKAVKEKIAKPVVEKGWSDVPDLKAQAEIKQKMKTEDPKKVPPPSTNPQNNAQPGQPPATTASAPPATGKSPANAPKPVFSPQAPQANPPSPSTPATAPDAGKTKKERLTRPTPSGNTPAPNLQGTTPGSTSKKPNDRRPEPASSLTNSPDGTPFRDAPTHNEPKKGKHERPTGLTPSGQQPEPPAGQGLEPRKQRQEPPPAPPTHPPSADNVPKQPLPPERKAPPTQQRMPEPPRKHEPRPQRTAAPAPAPGANPPAQEQVPHGKHGGEKKGGQPAPAPSPGL